MPIHVLPAEVASQIAAGEVVERPASVVKELVENALDAGARVISISVEGAGKRMIEVSDDGCGIPFDELALAVSRHATSKLSVAEDLFRISTLGFRGEALASIGSVARLTMVTKTAGGIQAGKLYVEAGHVEIIEPAGAPTGTTVRVADLFFNVPARLKFLKSDITERRQIDELVTRYALAYPHVRIQLHQDGRPALQTSGNGDRREILTSLYGVEIARNMLEVVSEEEGLGVAGYISPVTLTRSNRREITFFVNGRWVQDASLTTALVQAYRTMLMVGRYPLACLFLKLPAEMVDVNVHPAKAEVRFREKDRVFSGVQRAVRRALLAYTPVQGLEEELLWRSRFQGRSEEFSRDVAWADEHDWEVSGEEASQIAAGEALSQEPAQQAMPDSRMPLLRLVGQIASAYLVAEGPDGLYLVDQHAAHERVLFEQYMGQRQTNVPAQKLLNPEAVELPPASARLLVPQIPALKRIGFEVEEFGPNTFLVRAVPALLGGSDPAAAVRVVVEDFEEDETPLGAQLEAKIIARVCKRAAVKAGQTLSMDEQSALLAGLEACEAPRTCPHGRPTMIHLSVDLLERQFGRKS